MGTWAEFIGYRSYSLPSNLLDHGYFSLRLYFIFYNSVGDSMNFTRLDPSLVDLHCNSVEDATPLELIMHLSILGPTTPLRAVMGNYEGIFHLLDHKTCPIGGAFDFGY